MRQFDRNRCWRSVALAAVLAGSTVAAGCYRYVPVETATVPPGARVRAQLSAEGTERVRAGTGTADRGRVEGRVVERAADGALLLELPAGPAEAPVGVSARRLRARVTLPARDLVSLELRQLDRKRTAFFVAGSGALAALLVKLAFDTSGGGSESGGGGVDEAVVPIFSVRW